MLAHTEVLDTFTVGWYNYCKNPENYFTPSVASPQWQQVLGSGIQSYQVNMDNLYAGQQADPNTCGGRTTSYVVADGSNAGIASVTIDEVLGEKYFILNVDDPDDTNSITTGYAMALDISSALITYPFV